MKDHLKVLNASLNIFLFTKNPHHTQPEREVLIDIQN